MKHLYICCIALIFALTGHAQTSRVIHVATAGTLSNYISDAEKYTIEGLTLTGELNGTDFRLLRDMAGNNYQGNITEGKLSVLDLTNATLVASGEKYLDADRIYFNNGNRSVNFHFSIESADVFPQYAFVHCEKLTSVSLPNSVTSIGDRAFAGCIGLTSVNIPSSVTSIGNEAFFQCSGLTSVFIPSSVTSIGNGAFYQCIGLTSVNIPSSVTTIGQRAFYHCDALVSITLPGSLSAIGNDSFSRCQGLISVTLAEGLAVFNPLAFQDCPNLTSINVDINNETFTSDSGALYDKNMKTLVFCLPNITSFTIPYGVTSIGDGAFYQCRGLTSVNIPSSVTTIGQSAFYRCSGLTSVFIPSSVTSIGNGAFYQCSGLTSVNIPSSVTSLGNGAFYQCSGLTSVNIPSSVTTIGLNAFYQCIGLTSVNIPSSVTSIRDGAFYQCSGLTSVFLSNGVESISSNAFARCGALFSVNIPSSVKSIAGKAFAECINLTEFVVDSNNEFYSSESGVIMNKEKTMIMIFPSGKSECIISNSVTNISNGAFAGCIKLNNIIIEHQNPLAIHENIFSDYNYNNALLTIPVGATSRYQEASPWNKFVNIVEKGTPSVKRVLNLPSRNTLPYYISESDKYVIEELIVKGPISDDDFRVLRDMAGNNYKGEITNGKLKVLDLSDAKIEYLYWSSDDERIKHSYLGDSYNDFNIYYNNGNNYISLYGPHHINNRNQLPDYVFAGCEKLKTVILPNSMTSIERSAFEACSALEDIVIPSSVTSIGDSAFEGCIGLTSVNIPSSVTSIKDRAFAGCSGLTSLSVSGDNAKYDSRDNCNAIIETSSNTLVVGCKNTTIPNTVTIIGNSAFSDCNGLISISIPNSITSIGQSAFSNCSDLTAMTIPNSVTSISNSAFFGCVGLTSVTIPNSVNRLYDNTFAGCSSLVSIISEIVNPLGIEENVFDSSTYTKATLTVPFGSKTKYQTTDYWSKFTNIEEKVPEGEITLINDGIQYKGEASTLKIGVETVDAGMTAVEIPAELVISGLTFQVTNIEEGALSNRTFSYVSLPTTITTLSSSTFSNSTLGALIWNADTELSSAVFSNMSNKVDANFLLYVNNASYAPSNVKNVVVGTTASSITLADATNTMFYCPREFTANTISYTHQYSMETGGTGMGWETIALPFDVQRIEHETKGELTPFAIYNTYSNQRPFWLYEMGNGGFRRVNSIKANTPYIISMPNSSAYDDEYILAGNVTFSAQNAKVATTTSLAKVIADEKTFTPAFSVKNKAASVYALNVNNSLVTYDGTYDAGSRFISNLREVYPFEAYMTTASAGAPVLNIEFDNGETTDFGMLFTDKQPLKMDDKVYDLKGRYLGTWDNGRLSQGVYIVNGKKVVVK